eukprot:13423886-Alexandrium_andersonii.AAC.1
MEHARGTREHVIACSTRAVPDALPARCVPARTEVQAYWCLTCCPHDACLRTRGETQRARVQLAASFACPRSCQR